MKLYARHSLVALSVVSVAGLPGLAHAATGPAQFGMHHALAHYDLLPIAVVLGTGVLTWLLGNRRPRLEPARPRKPEQRTDRRNRKP